MSDEQEGEEILDALAMHTPAERALDLLRQAQAELAKVTREDDAFGFYVQTLGWIGEGLGEIVHPPRT